MCLKTLRTALVHPSKGLSSPLKWKLQFHRKLTELINAFLKARMLKFVVLGSGGNPRNTTDQPHPYIRILNRTVELTSECSKALFSISCSFS